MQMLIPCLTPREIENDARYTSVPTGGKTTQRTKPRFPPGSAAAPASRVSRFVLKSVCARARPVLRGGKRVTLQWTE